jgi:hypothetical protein
MFHKSYGMKVFGSRWEQFVKEVSMFDPGCMFSSGFSRNNLGVDICQGDTTKVKSTYSTCDQCKKAASPVTLQCGPNGKTYFHTCAASCDGVDPATLIPGPCRHPKYPHYGGEKPIVAEE